MNVTYIHTNERADITSYRQGALAAAINRSGRHQASLLSAHDFYRNTPEARQACEQADFLVLGQNVGALALQAIQYWRGQDKIIIADLEGSSYPFVEKAHTTGALVSEENRKAAMGPLFNSSDVGEQWWLYLKLVHAVTVPSKRMVDELCKYVPAYELPDYIDLRSYEYKAYKNKKGTVIGWIGEHSQISEFVQSGLIRALERVCRARPEVYVMIGEPATLISDQIDLPGERKISLPEVPYEQRAEVLARIDIGLAPLNELYADRLSRLRILEYLVLRIPWVASYSPAYYDLRNYGWLVKNSPAAWERILLDMIDHLPLYKAEAAGASYLFGLSQSLDENILQVLDVYQTIRKSIGRNGYGVHR